jgi:hypothetical protein
MDGGHGEQYEDQTPEGCQAYQHQSAVLRGLLCKLEAEVLNPLDFLGIE